MDSERRFRVTVRLKPVVKVVTAAGFSTAEDEARDWIKGEFVLTDDRVESYTVEELRP